MKLLRKTKRAALESAARFSLAQRDLVGLRVVVGGVLDFGGGVVDGAFHGFASCVGRIAHSSARFISGLADFAGGVVSVLFGFSLRASGQAEGRNSGERDENSHIGLLSKSALSGAYGARWHGDSAETGNETDGFAGLSQRADLQRLKQNGRRCVAPPFVSSNASAQ
jgi:hypothetical protein